MRSPDEIAADLEVIVRAAWEALERAEAERDALIAVAHEASRHQCFHFAVAANGGTRWCRICEAIGRLPESVRQRVEACK